MSKTEVSRNKSQHEMLGMALGAGGIFIGVALVSFNAQDLPHGIIAHGLETHNLAGRFGAHIARDFLYVFGLASYLVPAGLTYLAARAFTADPVHCKPYRAIGFGLLLVTVSSLAAFETRFVHLFGQEVPTGGYIGYHCADLFKRAFGKVGTMLLLVPALTASVMLLSKFSFSGTVGLVQRKWEELSETYRLYHVSRVQKGMEVSRETEEIKKVAHTPEIKIPVMVVADNAVAEQEEIRPLVSVVIDDEPLELTDVAEPAKVPPAKKEKGFEEKKEVVLSVPMAPKDGNIQLPQLSVLDPIPAAAKQQDPEVLKNNARLVEKKLKDFGVDGEVVEICPGPVITMYEFAPGAGIKVSRIANLSDDLSMALQATSIRIVAPIPGKGVVGIELPNKVREMVSLKEIFSTEEFRSGKMKLPLALGKDIAGNPLVADLAKMPHLLVAGATGSGKSVAINTMILSLLYTLTPRDVRLIMVDPKMLELSVYEGIPHLLLPVVTNPKKASLALKWAVQEMARRYKLMSDKGVRNIGSYNEELARCEKEKAENEARGAVVVKEMEEADERDEMEEREAAIQEYLDKEEKLEHGHLPYIVVIVDELADLMMVAGREIEEYIARLAQMARAAGIHLVLATQRPSVDVITGLIKANFPARISFQVSSKIDSRTILDTNGAESLLGAGDMLYIPPGTSRMLRSHGAFVSDAEVQRVVEFLKQQGKPVYESSIMEMKSSDDKGLDDEEMDEKYDEALAIVTEARQASISLIQRRLRIGYNRAARIIELMEKEGVIGPSDGTSKPREVYASRI